MQFGHWVKSERLQRGMRSNGCALRAGMTRSGWSNLEAKTVTPTTETVRKVACVFEITSEELMARAGLSATARNYDQEMFAFLERQTLKVPADDRARFRAMLMRTAEAMSSTFSPT